MMTIIWCATNCSYLFLGGLFGSQPHVDFRDLLINEIASMRDIFIKWPSTPAELQECMDEFSQLPHSKNKDQEHRFTQCVGAIDGTFVKICRPLAYTLDSGQEHNSYKKYYAIQILAVCRANLAFT